MRQLRTRDDLAALDAPAVAVVYVKAQDALPERKSRRLFEALERALRARSPAVPCFAIEGDEAIAREWLTGLGLAKLDGSSGAVVWLRRGIAVDYVASAADEGSEGLLWRTLALGQAD